MTHPAQLAAPLQWRGYGALFWLSFAIVAAAIAWLPLALAALLVAATTLIVAMLLRPALGLFALALAIPLGPQLRLPLGSSSVGITDALVAAAAAAWFAHHVVARKPLLRPPLLWFILPFGVALAYSTLAAASLEHALPELLKWLQVLLVYFLAVQMLQGRLRLALALTLLLAAAAEASLGLWQFFTGAGPEAYQLGPYLRAYGTFGQPNPYAGYLGLSLPLGLALSLWALSREQLATRIAPRRLFVLIPVCLTILIAAGLVASWSRGGWLGAAIAAISVLALSSVAGRLLILLSAVAGILALPLLPAALRSRLADLGSYVGVWDVRSVPVVTDQNFAVIERVAHWQAAWEMFADHPWLGVGVGNWDLAYAAYAIDRWQDPLGHAHNVLFHYAAVAGLAGALSYLWFWLGVLSAALLSAIRQHGIDRALAVGVFGLLVHLSIHNQFDNLFVQGMPLVVALALGLLTFPARTGRSSRRPSPKRSHTPSLPAHV